MYANSAEEDSSSLTSTHWNSRVITFVVLLTVSFVTFLTECAYSHTISALLAFTLFIVSCWELNQTRHEIRAGADNLDLTQACKKEGIDVDALLKNPNSQVVSRLIVNCLVKEVLDTKQKLATANEAQSVQMVGLGEGEALEEGKLEDVVLNINGSSASTNAEDIEAGMPDDSEGDEEMERGNSKGSCDSDEKREKKKKKSDKKKKKSMNKSMEEEM